MEVVWGCRVGRQHREVWAGSVGYCIATGLKTYLMDGFAKMIELGMYVADLRKLESEAIVT